MIKQSFFAVVCTCALSILALPVSAVTIDYSNIPTSQINLDPTDGCGVAGSVGCFGFTGPGSTNLQITSGSATGFFGNIDGLFGVGSILQPGFGVETATVTGTGTLTIFDGFETLTAALSWVDIGTFGTGGIINLSGNVNLTSIVYAGSNTDLIVLASAGSGTQTATFQFTSTMSLTDLFETSTSVTSASFSGSISAVPVPAAVWLFGSGLLGLVGGAIRRKS